MDNGDVNQLLYMILPSGETQPALFTSTKQIHVECSKVLSEWHNATGGNQEDNTTETWNFRDLLSWKIPDYLTSTSGRDS